MNDNKSNLSRAILEAETSSLWNKLERNKNILIRPYSTFYSALLLPVFFYQLLSEGEFFNDIRQNLQAQNRKTIHEILKEAFLEKLTLSEREIALEEFNMREESTLYDFEKKLPQLIISAPKEQAVFFLQNNGFENATLENYESIISLLPYRLDTVINIENEKHLLYLVAKFIDWVYLLLKNPLLFTLYHNIFIFLIDIHRPLTPQERERFPEMPGFLQQPNVTPGVTTCYRYAQLIHFLIPESLAFLKKKNLMLAPYVLNRLGKQLLGLSIGLTAVADIFIITPLLKKIAESKRLSRYRIMKCLLPMEWYLDYPLTTENYRLLDIDSLSKTNNQLKKALKKQTPYLKMSQILNKILIGLFLIFCIGNLFFTGEWSDQAFVFLPIMTGIIIKNLFFYSWESYATKQTERHLQELTSHIANIFSPVTDQILIVAAKKDNLLISYVTIKILKTYNTLPEKYLTTIIESTLHHFHIKINTYDETSISLSGTTCFSNLKFMRDFFAEALQASLAHYQLGQQLTSMVKKISSAIILEPCFNELTAPSWLISTTGTFSNLLTEIPGVTVKSNQIIILRQLQFSKIEMIKLINILSKVKKTGEIDFSPDMSNHKIKKSKNKVKQMETLAQPVDIQPITPESKPIVWRIAKVIFPDNKAIIPICNAAQRYMLFLLPIDAFGGDQEARDIFYAKSTQIAKSRHNAHGIKHGQYFGVDFFSGRQEIYKARIKVLGKYGNCGVLLKIESSSNGAWLYQARSFTTRIH